MICVHCTRDTDDRLPDPVDVVMPAEHYWADVCPHCGNCPICGYAGTGLRHIAWHRASEQPPVRRARSPSLRYGWQIDLWDSLRHLQSGAGQGRGLRYADAHETQYSYHWGE